MLKITDRDRIFAAIAVPVALVALHAYFIHRPLAKRVDAMEARLCEIGDADTLRTERALLERRREETQRRREATEADEKARLAAAATNATAEVSAPCDASARLRRVVALLGEVEGVRISSTTLLGTGTSVSHSAGLVREALGGESPTLWRFAVVADYGSVVNALRLLSERRLPAVVEAVSLEGAQRRADDGRAAGAAGRTWRIDVAL